MGGLKKFFYLKLKITSAQVIILFLFSYFSDLIIWLFKMLPTVFVGSYAPQNSATHRKSAYHRIEISIYYIIYS